MLVPDKSGSTYRRHQVDIVQTFHLEQIVNTPSQGPASQIEALIKKAKPLPSQPKNLRMRYTPFGSAPSQGKDSQGADDSDTEITFKDPMDVDQDRETKKQKKKRKHPDVDGPSVSQNAAGTESQSQVSIPRKKSKKAHTHEDATKQDSGEKGETQKQSTKHREMTSPDRRAKKEEKKRKKAEKDRAT